MIPYSQTPRFRLEEWPRDDGLTPGERQALRIEANQLYRVGIRTFDVPAVTLVSALRYVRAAAVADEARGLFNSLPAIVRARFANDTGKFLAAVRDRAVRDQLAGEEVATFEGEEIEHTAALGGIDLVS